LLRRTVFFCAAALVCAAGALAQEPRYRLVVDAPDKALREMLGRGLQLARWQDDAQMTPELLRRLADEAAVEAREALAAQGYFAALVSYSIERERTPWTVTLKVEPGARTVVRSVQLAFSGPGADDPEAARLLGEVRRDWLLKPGMPSPGGLERGQARGGAQAGFLALRGGARRREPRARRSGDAERGARSHAR
jgi:translocation and assembly module TamA